MKKVFVAVDTYDYGNRGGPDNDIIAIGESVAAIIDYMICMGFIREDTQVTPLATSHACFFLGEHFPSWKTELRFLTKNEFNEWFNYSFYKIEEFELITEEEIKKICETP